MRFFFSFFSWLWSERSSSSGMMRAENCRGRNKSKKQTSPKSESGRANHQQPTINHVCDHASGANGKEFPRACKHPGLHSAVSNSNFPCIIAVIAMFDPAPAVSSLSLCIFVSDRMVNELPVCL